MYLENCTLVELRQLAKEKGVKNVSKLKKEELVELLSNSTLEESNNQTEEKTRTENYNVNVTQNTINEPADGTYKLTNADDEIVEGILEVLPDGYGFLRGENYLSTP